MNPCVPCGEFVVPRSDQERIFHHRGHREPQGFCVTWRHGVSGSFSIAPNQPDHWPDCEFSHESSLPARAGLLESAYQACLAHELRNRGLQVTTQVGLPLIYEGHKLDVGYRIDLLVENRVIVEVKSVDAIHPIHEAQLLSHLRLSAIGIGLLVNFNVVRLRDGIKRMVDGKSWQK